MKTNSFKDADFDLIQKIKEGDTTAFKQLVKKYKDVSLSLVISIIKDQSAAEDILQDAFIKVFESIDRFKFESRFSTWLYRVVINTSYNALKRKKVKMSIDDMEMNGIIEPMVKGIDAINAIDQNHYIQQAFEMLRTDEALVLRLFYISELSISEIHKVTGFSVAKIKVDLHRGRGNMCFYLKKMLGDEVKYLL